MITMASRVMHNPLTPWGPGAESGLPKKLRSGRLMEPTKLLMCCTEYIAFHHETMKEKRGLNIDKLLSTGLH